MIRFVAVAAVALCLGTSAQAMPLAAALPVEGLATPTAFFCGPGRTRVGGVCVARTTKRQARRAVRRCAVWGAGNVCRRWY
jgi:hypothetical protein